MSDSLFASASRRPAANVASVTPSPAKPTTPLTHTSAVAAMVARASGPARTSVPAGTPASRRPASDSSAMATTLGTQRRACSIRSSTEVAAPRATTSKRSGSASTTSRVWVPIDPVDPASATVVVATAPAYDRQVARSAVCESRP